MDETFIAKMKEKLLEEKNEIYKSLEVQSEEMKGLSKVVDSGDDADIASDIIDRTLLNALGTQDSLRLQQINNALDRINQGTYGRCLKCGKEIPQARLESIPYAFLCVNCASEAERHGR